MNDTLRERLEKMTTWEPNSGCRLWLGSLRHGGYGQITYQGKTQRVHRLAYMLDKGPIPDGLVLDHLCRVPSCCNTDHLEAVTQRINTLRGVNHVVEQTKRTHCPKGHELTPENLLTSQLKYGKRSCKTCGVQRNRDWRKRVSMRTLRGV